MATHTGTIHHIVDPHDIRSIIRTRLARLRARLALWSERARRRQELKEVLEMPDELLNDMGITRDGVYREYRKPFWRE